jgi:apolipoprotein N-acyltransferase
MAMAACYWPLNLHWLAWVAMVPWLALLPRLSSYDAWLYGILMGLVFYRAGLAWLFSIHGFLAGTVILVLALWMGLAFRVGRRLMERWGTSAMLWAIPLAFVGQEVVRCEGLARLRFPFLAFGYSQAGNLWVAQTASLGGVYFVTFLVVLVNAAIACALVGRRAAACLPSIGAAGLVLALAWGSRSAVDAGPRIPVACVQAETSSYRPYLDLCTKAFDTAAPPRLVVLPEHTIADFADRRHPFVQALGRLARQHRAYICVGAHTVADPQARCDYRNVAMLIGPDGRVLNEQAKMVPLPFFEDGDPGRTQAVTGTELGVLGTYVCFDGLFTDIPRRQASGGAEILLVPNMDPRRWPAQERRQHADMARFRSIELRRCAVRANSAGISQVVDAAGRVTADLGPECDAGLLRGTVYPVRTRTVFMRGGHLFARAVGLAFVGCVVVMTLWDWTARLRLRTRPETKVSG